MKGVTVDREAGVIRGVLLCGFESANGRDYLPKSFGDGKQYEGKHSYLNHSKDARRTEDKIGWFSDVRLRQNGLPEADFNVIKSHPYAPQLFELAERNPSAIGLSHVAMCKTRIENGREKVESVHSVESVDLVAEPATTHGLHESKEKKMKLSELVEQLAPKLALKRILTLKTLSEMDDMGEMEVAPPADDAAPDDAAKGAMISGLHALVDAFASGSIDEAKLKSQFAEIVKTHGKLSDKPESPAEAPKQPDADEGKAEAKAKAKLELQQFIAEAVKSAVAEHVKPVAPVVKSLGRDGAAKLEAADAAKKTEATEAKPDGESFARRIEAKK